MSDENRRLIERFWETMRANDFRAVGDLLHDQYVLEWPQSGERIRGRENFALVNERYPAAGRWAFKLLRIVADERAGASEVVVTDGARVDRAVTFFEMREGRIWRMVEYWPEAFPAAEWRAQWVERS